MEKEQIFEKVKAIIKEAFDVPEEKITLEAKFYEDLDIDSLEVTEAIMYCEEDFAISLDFVTDYINTVQELVDLIASKL